MTDITLPAEVLTPHVNARVVCGEFARLNNYVGEASKIADDPMERMRLITSAILGNITNAFRKTHGMLPIPIPYGGSVQGLAVNGARVYGEHIGPKKEDMIFYLVGPNDEYTFSTTSQVSAILTGFLGIVLCGTDFCGFFDI